MLLPTAITAEYRTQVDARRAWSITYQAVNIDQGAYAPPPTRTWATALADSRFPTWGDLYSVSTSPDVYFQYWSDYLSGNATNYPG